MKYTSVQLTFQEVPNEISLCFLISGCPLRCLGCHSSDSWNAVRGTDLSLNHLQNLLAQFQGSVTCVCLLGGEWNPVEFISLCSWIQTQGLKTCLYTGLETVSAEILEVLDYLKLGPYRRELGGLQSPNTNQKFIDLKTGQLLNSYFQSQGGNHGSNDFNTDRSEDSVRTRLYEQL